MGPFTQQLTQRVDPTMIGPFIGDPRPRAMPPEWEEWFRRQRNPGAESGWYPQTDWTSAIRPYINFFNRRKIGRQQSTAPSMPYQGFKPLNNIQPQMMQGLRRQFLQQQAPNAGSARGGAFRPMF